MNTLFDKIWDAHVVTTVEDGPTQLYIDRLYCHEVTSPQAFAGLRERGIGVLRPEKVFCMPDHNTPTHDQDKEIEDLISKTQVDTLTKNAKDFGLTHYGMMHPKNGIIHVVGPERGLTLPGMTIVCGDSHTSTHGAMGAIAFGIGTSEVEMVLASQCILQSRPKTMRITVDGELGKGVTAKDVAFAGNDSQFVYFKHSSVQHGLILPFTLAVYAQAHTTPHFLPFLCLVVAVLQCTYLEHIRIIPTFFQGRVRKYKACWFIKRQ